jgi:hypothetical protein
MNRNPNNPITPLSSTGSDPAPCTSIVHLMSLREAKKEINNKTSKGFNKS